jgi:hypothetical protein
MARHAVAAVLLLAFLLGGCAARPFSSLQADYQDVIHQRAACGGPPNVDTVRRCTADDGAVLTDIARRARETTADASDERTRIGLLRLAAVAGWTSRTPEGFEAARAAAEEGQGRCAKLSPERFGAPRDCALLALAPAFIAHQETVGFLATLRRSGGAKEAGDLERLRAFSRDYASVTLGDIEAKRAAGAISRDAAPELDGYVTRQLPEMACTILGLSRANESAGNAELVARLSEQYARYAAKYPPDGGICAPLG